MISWVGVLAVLDTGSARVLPAKRRWIRPPLSFQIIQGGAYRAAWRTFAAQPPRLPHHFHFAQGKLTRFSKVGTTSDGIHLLVSEPEVGHLPTRWLALGIPLTFFQITTSFLRLRRLLLTCKRLST